MLCSEIVSILDKQSPPEYALDWDNVGLLVGRKNKEVKKLLLVVDATREVCEYAVENGFDMIVSHHPMIFKSVKKINDGSVLGEKILSLAELYFLDPFKAHSKSAGRKLGKDRALLYVREHQQPVFHRPYGVLG